MLRKTRPERPQKRRRWAKRRVAFLFVFALLCFMLFELERQIRPVILTMAEYECKELSIQKMNAAVAQTLAETPELYENIYHIERAADGSIASVTADPVAVNRIKTELTQRVSNTLEELGAHAFRIPLGSLLGWQLLAGRGPDIDLWALPESFVYSDITTTLETAGINQTELRVFVVFKVDMSAIMAGYSVDVQVENEVCIAQTLIVGEVPDFYVG